MKTTARTGHPNRRNVLRWLFALVGLPAFVLACGHTFREPVTSEARGLGGAPPSETTSSSVSSGVGGQTGDDGETGDNGETGHDGDTAIDDGPGLEAPETAPPAPAEQPVAKQDGDDPYAEEDAAESADEAPPETPADGAGALMLLRGGADARCLPSECELELVFSEAVRIESVTLDIDASPKVALKAQGNGLARRVVFTGNFRDRTDYTFSLSSKLCTPGGACLGEEREVVMKTGGGYANVRMPVRNTVIPTGEELPMRFEQVDEATLTLIPLRTQDVVTGLSLAGIHYAEQNPLDKLPKALRARAKTIAIEVDEDIRKNGKSVDPFALAKAPVVLAVLDAPHAYKKVGVFQRGELTTLLKVGTESGLVWVTDTATGKPVPAASVSIVHDRAITFRGNTDAKGLLRLPKGARLRVKGKVSSLAAVVQQGGRTAVTSQHFEDGMTSWMYNLPQHAYAGPNAIRGMVTAERGIYRPGESVHLLGILRKRRGDGVLVPPGGQGRVVVKDPKGGTIADRAVALTAFGTLRSQVKVPPHATIGRYHVTLKHGQTSVYSSFEVGEFKSSAFEVTLPGDVSTSESRINVPLAAQYLHGAAVAKGKVKWTASWRHRMLRPAGLETFSFVSDLYGYHGWQHLTEAEEELGTDGKLELQIAKSALPAASEAQALDILVEATVTDAAGDIITARRVVRHERVEAAVGTRSKQWVVSPKLGWTVDFVAAKGGKAVAGEELEVELHRSYWSSVAEKGPHGIRYRSSREDKMVKSQTITTEDTPKSVRFDIEGGGSYELKVRAKKSGYEVSRRVWAHGDEATAPVENTPRMKLHVDKTHYEPGEVATVYAENPYAKATALVTVERAGVLESRVMQLDGAEQPIALKLTQQHLPNAFVSVTVVPRREKAATPVTGNPLRAGYKELRVSPASRRLKVSVLPAEDALRPGENAAVRVKVTDQNDKPVRAEVTLWAADEGVLMLTGYATPDPFEPVYAAHALEVRSALNLVRWMSSDPNDWLDGGGDGGGPTSAMRSRMLHTAFFSKGVTTNSAGEAVVKFDVPDNLTRWRVMAVAADSGQRFGKGESAIRVSKPLMVMPALPRFVTIGDTVDAGFVVHNQTGADVEAEVSLAVSGADLVGDKTAKVKVATGTQKALSFPIVVREPGQVRFQAKVSAGQHADALAVSLPAHPATVSQQTLVAEGVLEGSSTRSIDIPQEARDGSVEVFVTVSPTALASLEPSIQSLIDYPHGCAEQKTSRLVPMVLLGDLVKDLEIAGFDQKQHRERLQSTLAQLEKHQNPDGGFGLWVDSATDGFISAYVLFGWTVAKEHGFDVNMKAYDRGVAYLQKLIRDDELGAGYFEYDPKVFTAYVLALAGKDDHGLAHKLYEARKDMSQLERALLASTLLQRKDADAKALLGEIEAAWTRDRGMALLKESKATGYYAHGADLRATAAAAEAFARAGRTDDAGRLVLGLLRERGPRGTWGTTHNNLWALYAMSAFSDKAPPKSAPKTVRVKMGERQLGALSLTGRSAARLTIPASALASPGGVSALTLSSEATARPHFVIRMRYLPKRTSQGVKNAGYELSREIVDAHTGKTVTSPKVGQLLRVRVKVKIDAYRHQVAVVDRLPAGLEAVDPRLKTSLRAAKTTTFQWESVELRDASVSVFSYGLYSGEHTFEYLAHVSRSGDFVWPAVTAESMYQPDENGRNAIGRLVVKRK